MKSKPYVFFRTLLGGVFKLLYRVHFHGRENEPQENEGAYIIISNHTSNMDPVLLCTATKHQQLNFMAKKELFSVPVVGKIVSWMGAYSIDRSGTDVGALRKTIEMLKEGKCIGIFPQGHRYKYVDPAQTEVKSGLGLIAVRSGAKILPCYIKTEKNCLKMFRRTDIYIGKPVTVEELGYDPAAPKGEGYMKVSENAFKRCCELSDCGDEK